MDYLKEGINLRAMGQRDPLVEWQREGYQMFEQMMHGISQDFVTYVMKAQVSVAQRDEAQAADAPVQNMRYSAAEDPVQGSAAVRATSAPGEAAAAASARAAGAPDAPPAEEERNVPVVKSDWEKTPRNAPCPCGSGKKFKLCHGR
jgi:preprotein translocase subunit SecA